MSSFNLGKKLQPANKAWKSFTTKLQSKLQKLKLSKPIKKTKHHHYYHHHQLQNNFSAIYVDQLFEGPACHTEEMKAKKQEKLVRELGSNVLNEKALKRRSEKGETSTFKNLDDAWKATVASLPLVRGVDERAEEFISKFHEDMKIQREQSILDFQEMLARGV